MSTGYGWEGIRQVCATLLGARHVPECLCGGACLQRGTITSVRPLVGLNAVLMSDDMHKFGVPPLHITDVIHAAPFELSFVHVLCFSCKHR